MKKIFVLCFFLSVFTGIAQSVNDYQYVIVPAKFSFLKKPNEYGLNMLTKKLLEKYGFVTFYDTDEFPVEVGDYNCNKLYADVEKDGSFVNTKLRVVLKDCKGNTLFATENGKSKEKEYGPAYIEALRGTAKSFDDLQYKYNGSVIGIEKSIVKTTNDGTAVKTEIIPVVTSTPVAPKGKDVYFAQPILNGFQLVDTAPKVIMKIYNTNSKDLFIAEKGELKGVLRNDAGNWVFEHYADGKLQSEAVYIKF